MGLSIRLTSDMTADEMGPLWPDIIGCLEKYVARFQDEETVSNILTQCQKGNRQLWIVQDETGRVVLTPITEIVTIDATGKKRLLLAEVGGARLRESMPLLEEIEKWGRDQGAEDAQLIGRNRGWSRHLSPLGYAEVAYVYRKTLRE